MVKKRTLATSGPGASPRDEMTRRPKQPLAQGLSQHAAEVDLVERAEAEEKTEGASGHGVAIKEAGHHEVRTKLLRGRQVNAEGERGTQASRRWKPKGSGKVDEAAASRRGNPAARTRTTWDSRL
jgi:hypothetical protein